MRAKLRHVTFVAMLVASLAAQACRPAPVVLSPPRVAAVSCMTGSGIELEPPHVVPPEGLSLDDDGASVIHPCKAKTPSHVAAKDALDAVGGLIRGLADDASAKNVEEVKDALVALLDTECFALGRGDPNEGFDFDSGLAFKAWWDDGGEAWAEHYLGIDGTRRTVVPPTPRHSLTLVSTPSITKTALAPLLCPPGDARATTPTGCGYETLGWAKRADRALARRAAASYASWSPKSEADCAKEALAADAALRFSAYRDCIEHVPARRSALPLGRFKAPADGWFIIKGADRHRCVELYAYDLRTGAAYRLADCAGRGVTSVVSEAGRIPVATLREAVWMLLLTPAVDVRIRTEATTFEVPQEIPISRPADHPAGRSLWGSCGGGTLPRPWSWMREKNGVLVGHVSGTLRWPEPCDDAEDHGAELLAVAEAGFEIGCVPAAAPANVTWSAPGIVPGGGKPWQLDDPSLAPLRDALAAAARGKRRVCNDK